MLTGITSDSHAQQEDPKTGIFNHTQTDSTGNPDWINLGNWSVTGINTTSPSFNAVIDMAKPNGSEAHEHKVSEFELVGEPVIEGQTVHLNGTSTITMRDGPVTDAPTVIALSEEAIDIYFDPNKVDNHFGNQSISGMQN